MYCFAKLSEGSIRRRKMMADATAAFDAGVLDASRMVFADAVGVREDMLDSGSLSSENCSTKGIRGGGVTDHL